MATRHSAAARAGATLVSLDDVLAGVSDYRKTAVTMRAYRRTLALVDNFVRRLRVQRTRLLNVLVDILEEQVPATGLDARIEKSLKFRLGIFIGPFIDAVVEISDGVRNQAQLALLIASAEESRRANLKTGSIASQDVGCTGSMSWFDRLSHAKGTPAEKIVQKAFKDRYKSFAFALEDGSLSKALDGMDLYNHKLEVLTQQALRMRPVAKSDLRKMEKIRNYAVRMSRTLTSKSGFSCRCSHKIMLRIEEPVKFSSYDDSDDEEREQATFQLAFSYRTKEHWCWVQSSASILDCEVQAKAETTESNIELATAEPTEPKKKKVQFETFTGVKSAVKFFQRPTSSDLCQFLRSSHTSESSDRVQRFSLSCDQFNVDLCFEDQDSSELWSGLLSYHDLITNRARVTLSLESRLRLAAKAAASMLYLHRTVWLDPRFTSLSHSLLFVQRKDGAIKSEPCFQQPERDCEAKKVGLITDGRDPTLYVQHKDPNGRLHELEVERHLAGIFEPTLFALGIFLLELSYHQSWTEIRASILPRNDNISTTGPFNMDLAAIDKILRDPGNEDGHVGHGPFEKEGPFYMEAVRGCFSVRPGPDQDSSYDGKFCETAYENVVWHLQCALQLQLDTESLRPEIEECDSSSFLDPSQLSKFSLFDEYAVKSEKDGTESDKWFKQLRQCVSVPLSDVRKKRVRVAILDSGIDRNDDFLEGKIRSKQLKYRSFIGNQRVEDCVGHGTHTAALLFKVAPHADVLVGRITSDGKQWKSEQIVEAIQWARDEGVDIITMSFGFQLWVPDIKDIRSAILNAAASNIIFFAAASNGGANYGIAFPAKEDQVICIGSTDYQGNKSDFTPTPDQYNKFATLGEAVKSSWLDGISQRKSGTSFAAPIAAGIAANVMDFTREIQDLDPELVSKLGWKRGMEAILRLMCESRDGYEYIAPWKLFNKSRNIAALIEDTLKLV